MIVAGIAVGLIWENCDSMSGEMLFKSLCLTVVHSVTSEEYGRGKKVADGGVCFCTWKGAHITVDGDLQSASNNIVSSDVSLDLCAKVVPSLVVLGGPDTRRQ